MIENIILSCVLTFPVPSNYANLRTIKLNQYQELQELTYSNFGTLYKLIDHDWKEVAYFYNNKKYRSDQICFDSDSYEI